MVGRRYAGMEVILLYMYVMARHVMKEGDDLLSPVYRILVLKRRR